MTFIMFLYCLFKISFYIYLFKDVFIHVKFNIMVALGATIMKIALNIAAGIGVANVFDNWVKPKVPNEYYPEKIGTGLNVWKIIWLTAAFLASFMVLNWLGKATGIQILKRKI